MKELDKINAREEIIEELRKLLIGPLEKDEILKEIPFQSGPTDFYVTGILWPRYKNMEYSEDDNTKVEGVDEVDEYLEDLGTPLFNMYKPSSMGITCTIKGSDAPFEIIIKGARYRPEVVNITDGQNIYCDSNIKNNEYFDVSNENTSEQSIDTDNQLYNWIQEPFEYIANIDAYENNESWYPNIINTNDGKLVDNSEILLHVKRRIKCDTMIVTATMINNSIVEDFELDKHCLFQTELIIRVQNENQHGIISRPAIGNPQDEEDMVNELLYRDYQEFAVGHGISTIWPVPQNGMVPWIKTDWLPKQSVSSVSPDGHDNLHSLRISDRSPFEATFLSDINNKEIILISLTEFCEIYKNWIEEQRNRLDSISTDLKKAANKNLNNCNKCYKRMIEGISVLKSYPIAFEAFCLANKVMNYQVQLLHNKNSKYSKLTWRPFQLGFILLSIPSIVIRDHQDRDCLDLLWFPTGGGKTEAYLGLISFTIFYRRLTIQNDLERGHVDVIMRYTLRLLTVQQFQRASAMICAADLIRKQQPLKLGNVPISIGLFVGQAATPNKLCGQKNQITAQNAINEEQNEMNPTSTPRLLLECPLCGSMLTPLDYSVDCDKKRMKIQCSNTENCPSKGDSLPIHTVDEDIYKVLPSLVIGTVDKFAQLPRNQNIGLLFGRPTGLPPELIIQDELHLISGPMGTMMGLYESCIDKISEHKDVKAKIIGSTATIGRADLQVRALFDRDVFQFPPPALESDQSFFSVRDDNIPDRMYLGISSAGKSPTFTLQAAVAAFCAITNNLISKLGYSEKSVDPYWTNLLYFTSLRELGGAQVLMLDSVPRSINFYSNRLECEKRILEQEPIELTSRVTSTKIPKILQQLEFPLDGDPFEGMAVDFVLASNMISVGVDISRLGLMVVNGQPKSTSEFIQATSRVGRGLPGIVLTIYNASRPRDISHFEHFKNFHQALYRKVETSSVTPWSSRARDRALHAIFAALVRYLIPGMLNSKDASSFDSSNPQILKIVDYIEKRVRSAGQEHSDPEETKKNIYKIIEEWNQRAYFSREAGQQLEYWARLNPYNNVPVLPHLMRGSEDNFNDPNVWRTPNSMREVEPSTFYVEWDI